MILTDFYRAELLTTAKHRYDVTASTQGYDLFESLLINKRSFNVGGLSFNLVPQPDGHSGRKADFIISKGSHSITKVFRPDIASPGGHGDINGTNDGLIILFNEDFKTEGIKTIELLIARGCKADRTGLFNLYLDGELSHEIETIRAAATAKNIGAERQLKIA